MSALPMQFGVAPKELTFPKHTQMRKEVLVKEAKTKLAPLKKVLEPLPAVARPPTPAVRVHLHCTYCNRNNHDESGCFLLHRDKLALYLEINSRMKIYWDERVRNFDAYLERKKKRTEAAHQGQGQARVSAAAGN